ncbi:MAG TPA: hypothetical protein VKZ96_04540 [Thermomicrobiales bacterium]|nr:hypothetical protein [Thermomicrobiales bacterium]
MLDVPLLLALLHGGKFTWDEFLMTFVLTFGLAGIVYALTRVRAGDDYDDEELDLPESGD